MGERSRASADVGPDGLPFEAGTSAGGGPPNRTVGRAHSTDNFPNRGERTSGCYHLDPRTSSGPRRRASARGTGGDGIWRGYVLTRPLKWLTVATSPRGGKRVRRSVEGRPGEYRDIEIVRTVRHQGRVVVNDHVPAEVCWACGDVPPGADTAIGIEALLRTTARTAGTVPLDECA
jgi:hypothetical protein